MVRLPISGVMWCRAVNSLGDLWYETVVAVLGDPCRGGRGD